MKKKKKVFFLLFNETFFILTIWVQSASLWLTEVNSFPVISQTRILPVGRAHLCS